MTALIGSAPTTLWAPPSVAVALKALSVVLPRFGSEPELALDLASLQLLAELVSAEGLPVDAAAPGENDALTALAARGLLLERAPRVRPATVASSVESREPADALTDDRQVVLPTPLLLGCGPRGFTYVDHDGVETLWLRPVEVLASVQFGLPTTVSDARTGHTGQLGAGALSDAEFADLAERLWASGLLVPFDPLDPVHARQTRQAEAMRDGMRRQAKVHAEFDRIEAEHDASAPAVDRVKVVGVHPSWSGLPASLAMIIAAAKDYDGGRLEESFDFRPRLFWDRARLEQHRLRISGHLLVLQLHLVDGPQPRAVGARQGAQPAQHRRARRSGHAEVPR